LILLQAHAYSLQTDRAWAALLQLTESFPDESLDASLFSTLALACALVNEPELAKKALLGADKLLSKQQANYLNVESKDTKDGKNGKGADAASHSHAMFERLAADEARRECDRVRMLLVSRGAALSAVLKTYGRFPKCPRVHLQPQHTLNLRNEFAALPDYTKKTKNITHTNSASVARKMKLEVCSGLGDWVVQHAENEPHSDWIALELRRDRVFQIWSKMVFRELNNLLILGGDAHKIVRDSFEGGVLDEIWINFPEPPGWAGSKLRLIDRAFLLQLHRALKEDAWVTVVTDDRQYAMECVREFQALKDVYCSAFGDEAFLTELPSDYGRASYFDRMWTNGRKDDRFFLRFCKCAPTPAAAAAAVEADTVEPLTVETQSDDDIELDGAEMDEGDDADGSDSDE
jgi:tRNA G46 methylase TrmB